MQPSSARHDRHETAYDRHTTVMRVTVPQAAQILGTTPDAVRSRLRRGKLRKDTAEDGTVLVVLDAGLVDGRASFARSDGHDGQEKARDGQADGQGSETSALLEAKDQTIGHLSEQLEFLRQQLREEREESRRKDHLLAAALEKIPTAIEPPPDTPSESRQGPSEPQQESRDTQTSQGHPEQETGSGGAGQERRSWWRRLLEG
jgi:hypothetical protein